MGDDPAPITRAVGYVIVAVLMACVVAIVIAITWRLVQAII